MNFNVPSCHGNLRVVDSGGGVVIYIEFNGINAPKLHQILSKLFVRTILSLANELSSGLLLTSYMFKNCNECQWL